MPFLLNVQFIKMLHYQHRPCLAGTEEGPNMADTLTGNPSGGF